MKKQITAIITAAFILVNLTACNNSEDPVNSNNQTSSDNSSQTATSGETSTEETSTDETSIIPTGEPTFLIGLDGKAILTGEIMRLENTDKTAETLTEDDLWAEVYCDGFAYCKLPMNVGYDSYKNPELFDEFNFQGEIPENKNDWIRVYPGDEICGLKVKSAVTGFKVNDYKNYKFPEKHFKPSNNIIEFEGTVEAEGFFQVTPDYVMYPDTGECVYFYPTVIGLPLLPSDTYIDREKDGYITELDTRVVFDHFEFGILSEFDTVTFGESKFADIGCDTDGIGVGDVAYARVTLKDIRCVGSSIEATLEKVTRLSDILVHDVDQTEAHQPSPTA